MVPLSNFNFHPSLPPNQAEPPRLHWRALEMKPPDVRVAGCLWDYVSLKKIKRYVVEYAKVTEDVSTSVSGACLIGKTINHMILNEDNNKNHYVTLLTRAVDVNLSTKPKKAIGDDIWVKAMCTLKDALDDKGRAYEVDEGHAFYGPKIDLKIKDALGRKWQSSTIQELGMG